MEEKQDIKLNEMSEEELKNYIQTQGQVEDEVEIQQSEESKVEVDTIQESDNNNDADVEKGEVESEEHNGQTDDETENIPIPFRGKTPQELVKIIEENNRYITKQGQRYSELKKQMVTLQSSIDDKLENNVPTTKAQRKDFVRDLVEEQGYSEEDINVISQLVEHTVKSTLTKAEKEKALKVEEQRKQNIYHNQETWDMIKDLYPDSTELEREMLELIEQDKMKNGHASDTMCKPGWVKKFVKSRSQLKKEPSSTQVRSGVEKRLAKTVTAKSSGRSISNGSISRADLSSKDPETFRRAWNHFNPNSPI